MQTNRFYTVCEPINVCDYFILNSKCLKNEQTNLKHCDLIYDYFILTFHYCDQAYQNHDFFFYS
jgi:hypothetical protein